MGIDLYAMMESPPCRAVLMTAKILNVDFNIKLMDLSKQEHLSDEEFGNINPQKCFPTINDNGFILWERYRSFGKVRLTNHTFNSRAIMRYLVDKYGDTDELYPREVHIRAKIDQMLDFDIGTLYKHEGLFLCPVFEGKPTNKEEEVKFRKSLQLLNTILNGKQFVASDKLTIADISLIASLSFAEAAEFDFSEYANVVEWIKRLKENISCYEEINATAMHNFTQWMRHVMKKDLK